MLPLAKIKYGIPKRKRGGFSKGPRKEGKDAREDVKLQGNGRGNGKDMLVTMQNTKISDVICVYEYTCVSVCVIHEYLMVLFQSFTRY